MTTTLLPEQQSAADAVHAAASTVLVVEDDHRISAFLDRALVQAGYRVALADFPQQARFLQVRATPGGGAVLETWMLDTAPGRLTDTARELAYLDAQGGRPDGDAGAPLDRNVRLFRAP